MEPTASKLIYDLVDFKSYLDLNRFHFNLIAMNGLLLAISTDRCLILTDDETEQQSIKVAIEYDESLGFASALAWITTEIICVGFENGTIVCFTFEGKQIFQFRGHSSPVKSIKLYEIASRGNPSIWIMFEGGYLISIPLSRLININDRQFLAFRFSNHTTLNDFVFYPFVQPNSLFEEEPATCSVLVAGKDNSLAVYNLGGRLYFQDFNKLAGYVKDTMSNMISRSLMSFFVSGIDSSSDEISRTEEYAVTITSSLDFSDSKRRVLRVSIDPSSRLVAAADSLGRVTLFDTQAGCVVRLWKGLRDARLAWTHSWEIPENGQTETDKKSPSRADDDEERLSLSLEKVKEVEEEVEGEPEKVPTLHLVIYAPQLGLVSLFRMPQGGCVRIVPVGMHCQLFSVLEEISEERKEQQQRSEEEDNLRNSFTSAYSWQLGTISQDDSDQNPVESSPDLKKPLTYRLAKAFCLRALPERSVLELIELDASVSADTDVELTADNKNIFTDGGLYSEGDFNLQNNPQQGVEKANNSNQISEGGRKEKLSAEEVLSRVYYIIQLALLASLQQVNSGSFSNSHGLQGFENGSKGGSFYSVSGFNFDSLSTSVLNVGEAEEQIIELTEMLETPLGDMDLFWVLLWVEEAELVGFITEKKFKFLSKEAIELKETVDKIRKNHTGKITPVLFSLKFHKYLVKMLKDYISKLPSSSTLPIQDLQREVQLREVLLSSYGQLLDLHESQAKTFLEGDDQSSSDLTTKSFSKNSFIDKNIKDNYSSLSFETNTNTLKAAQSEQGSRGEALNWTIRRMRLQGPSTPQIPQPLPPHPPVGPLGSPSISTRTFSSNPKKNSERTQLLDKNSDEPKNDDKTEDDTSVVEEKSESGKEVVNEEEVEKYEEKGESPVPNATSPRVTVYKMQQEPTAVNNNSDNINPVLPPPLVTLPLEELPSREKTNNTVGDGVQRNSSIASNVSFVSVDGTKNRPVEKELTSSSLGDATRDSIVSFSVYRAFHLQMRASGTSDSNKPTDNTTVVVFQSDALLGALALAKKYFQKLNGKSHFFPFASKVTIVNKPTNGGISPMPAASSAPVSALSEFGLVGSGNNFNNNLTSPMFRSQSQFRSPSLLSPVSPVRAAKRSASQEVDKKNRQKSLNGGSPHNGKRVYVVMMESIFNKLVRNDVIEREKSGFITMDSFSPLDSRETGNKEFSSFAIPWSLSSPLLPVQLLTFFVSPLIRDVFSVNAFSSVVRASGFSGVGGLRHLLPLVFGFITLLPMDKLMSDLLSKSISTSPFQRWLRDNLLNLQEMVQENSSFVAESLDLSTSTEPTENLTSTVETPKVAVERQMSGNLAADFDEEIKPIHQQNEGKQSKSLDSREKKGKSDEGFNVVFELTKEVIRDRKTRKDPNFVNNSPGTVYIPSTDMPTYDEIVRQLLRPCWVLIRRCPQLEASIALTSLVLEVLLAVEEQVQRRTYGASDLTLTITAWTMLVRQLRLLLLLSSRMGMEETLESALPLTPSSLNPHQQQVQAGQLTVERLSLGEVSLHRLLAADTLSFTVVAVRAVEHEERCQDAYNRRAAASHHPGGSTHDRNMDFSVDSRSLTRSTTVSSVVSNSTAATGLTGSTRQEVLLAWGSVADRRWRDLLAVAVTEDQLRASIAAEAAQRLPKGEVVAVKSADPKPSPGQQPPFARALTVTTGGMTQGSPIVASKMSGVSPMAQTKAPHPQSPAVAVSSVSNTPSSGNIPGSSSSFRKRRPLLLFFPKHSQLHYLGAYRSVILAERWSKQWLNVEQLLHASQHLFQLPANWCPCVAALIFRRHVLPILKRCLLVEEDPTASVSAAGISGGEGDGAKNRGSNRVLKDSTEVGKGFNQVESISTTQLLELLSNYELLRNFVRTAVEILSYVEPAITSEKPVSTVETDGTQSDLTKDQPTRKKTVTHEYYEDEIPKKIWPVSRDSQLTALQESFEKEVSTLQWNKRLLNIYMSVLWVLLLRRQCGLRGVKPTELLGENVLSFLDSTIPLSSIDQNHFTEEQTELSTALHPIRIEFLDQCLHRLIVGKTPKDGQIPGTRTNVNNSDAVAAAPAYSLARRWAVPRDTILLLHITALMKEGRMDEQVEQMIPQVSDRQKMVDTVIQGLRLRMGALVARLEQLPSYGPLLASMDADALTWARRALSGAAEAAIVGNTKMLENIAQGKERALNLDLAATRHLIICIQSVLLAVPVRERHGTGLEDESGRVASNVVSSWIEQKSRCDALLTLCKTFSLVNTSAKSR